MRSTYCYIGFLLSCFISLTSIHVQSQEKNVRISGVITDAASGETLPSVNVYLSGTTTGTAAKDDGYYVLETDLTGEYILIVSFLGYKPIQKKVFLNEGMSYDYDFSLQEDVLSMGEVKVEAEIDRDFLQRVYEFRQFFIGNDKFADKTKILNPEVLRFEWLGSSNEYSATSIQPLKLENEALGYKIEVIIDEVQYDPIQNIGYWRVFSRYTEMETDSRRKRREWSKNRKDSYEGSSRHFFLSLYNDKVRSNQFSILPRRSAIREVTDINEIRRAYPRQWNFISENYKVFSIEDINTLIGYKMEQASRFREPSVEEMSQIQVNTYSGLVLIDRFGNLYRPETVQLLGKWSKERFSRSLPINYRN